VQERGTPFGAENDAFDAGYRKFRLEPGSRLGGRVRFVVKAQRD
jgi:hypothetical protein